jgi:hypothetical protein
MAKTRMLRAREMAGLSRSQVYKLLGIPLDCIHGQWLTDLETGDLDIRTQGEPSIRRFADLYGVSRAWLLGADPVVPDNVVRALRDADISPSDRETLLEVIGAIATPER